MSPTSSLLGAGSAAFFFYFTFAFLPPFFHKDFHYKFVGRALQVWRFSEDRTSKKPSSLPPPPPLPRRELAFYIQCPGFGTVSLQNKVIPRPGHWGIGFKKTTVVGLKV